MHKLLKLNVITLTFVHNLLGIINFRYTSAKFVIITFKEMQAFCIPIGGKYISFLY